MMCSMALIIAISRLHIHVVGVKSRPSHMAAGHGRSSSRLIDAKHLSLPSVHTQHALCAQARR